MLTLSLLALASCAPDKPASDNTQIRIGYLNGPTGIGMAKLINDYKNDTAKYTFKSYNKDNAAAMAELKTNKVDIICLPTNVAASYHKSANDNCVVLAINTLNTLFFISDENNTVTRLEDLNGKTVYTCEAGTPKVILEALLEKAKISATVKTTTEDGSKITDPEALQAQIVAGKVPIAFAPEPIVSASSMARTSSGKSPYSVDINCDTVWKKHFGESSVLPMGCIVANKTFVNEHPTVIKEFLKEYKASVEYMSKAENIDSASNYVADAGVLPNVNVAKSALKNLGGSISYIDKSDMTEALKNFYTVIGQLQPDNDFYYEK